MREDRSVALLFHTDESFDTKNHVQLGVLASGGSVAEAQLALDDIVEWAYEKGMCRSGAELHGTEVHGGRGQWSKATNIADRVDLYGKVLDVLSDCGVEVILHGAKIKHLKHRYGLRHDPYRWEFINVLERLNERLRSLDDYAVVIADQQHQHRGRVQRDVIDCRVHGTPGYRTQKLDRILDTAHFVDSELSRMIQLADMVAFVARRRLSVPRESDPRAEVAMADLDAKVRSAVPDPKAKYLTIRT